MLLGALFLLVPSLGALAAEEFCYSHEPHYNFFASKTVYDMVRDIKGRISNVPNCDPVMVWGLFRHGTRYPHKKEIKKQRDLLHLRDNVLRNHKVSPRSGELCWDDIDLLKDWTYNITEEDSDKLTSSGVTESYLLGKRLRTDFPTILDATYSEDRFKIRYTEKIRTKDTADAFTRGLFGNNIDLPDEWADGPLLEPNHNCSTWKTSTKSEGAEKQTKTFREGHLMKQLITTVSRRLGFLSDLTLDAILDIYNMCRFDKAWQQNKANSAWCVAFTQEELKLLEYDEDLQYYYESGYGNPFSSMLGCPIVSDLIHTFQNKTQANGSYDGPSAILYFTHSLTLRSALIRLGIARDQTPITSNNYANMEKRQWKTSLISPFAGNLVAVLYKCGDVFKVMFYLNERHVDYEGCDVGLCNWTYIYDRFASIVNTPSCSRDFCRTSGSPLGAIAGYSIFLSLILSVLYLK